MARKRVCDAAVEILRETDNPAVGFGDSGLLHMIAERAGRPHNGYKTEGAILNALSRQPGILVPRYYRGYRDKLSRVFYLPDSDSLKSILEREKKNGC